MSLPVCPICEREFVPNPAKVTQQRFCSTNCRRREKGRRRRAEGKDRRLDKVCLYGNCAQPFKAKRSSTKFCSNRCRNDSHRYGFDSNAIRPYGPRTRLRCIRCGGRHLSTVCGVGRKCVKQFGSVGPNREYVPPPGVKVRVRHLPYAMFGDQLPESKGGCR